MVNLKETLKKNKLAEFINDKIAMLQVEDYLKIIC